MVRQLFVQETVQVGQASRVRMQLALGEHPEVYETDDGTVTTATAKGTKLRVVFDEILEGGRLEMMACQDGSFSVVPDGTTPDDVARCAGPVEALAAQGCEAVCISSAGPVGIQDNIPAGGGDGAADDFQLRQFDDGSLPISIVCDGVEIPINRADSFWSPAGNQLPPAVTDIEARIRGLGPALVIATESGLRTSSSCTLSFSDQVVDKDGNQVCSPVGGKIENGCTAGDTSLLTFGVEPLSLVYSDPLDGATGVSVDATLFLQFNAQVDLASFDSLVLEEVGGAEVPLEASFMMDDKEIVYLEVPGGLASDTDYVLTIPTTVTDTFGGAFPAEETLQFTTGMGAVTPDAAVDDAGTADAGI